MDVQQTDVARQKKRKRTLLIGVALAAVILVSIGLAQLEPAATAVRLTADSGRNGRGPARGARRGGPMPEPPGVSRTNLWHR